MEDGRGRDGTAAVVRGTTATRVERRGRVSRLAGYSPCGGLGSRRSERGPGKSALNTLGGQVLAHLLVS